MWLCRDPRQPFSTSYSNVEYPRATAATASAALRDRQARPRFVCSVTPVPLMAGRREGRAVRRARLAAEAASSILPGRASRPPERACWRSSSRTSRTASRAIPAGSSSASEARGGRPSSSSTLGILRKRSCRSMQSRSRFLADLIGLAGERRCRVLGSTPPCHP